MTAGATTLPAGRTLGISVTLAAALALAINNVSMPYVYHAGWNAQSVALVRFIFATAVVALALVVWGRSLRLAGRDAGHAIGSGLTVAIGALGLLGSFQFIPVSLAIVIVYTNPVLTAVMLSLWHRRWPSLLQIACLVVAFFGVAIAIGIDNLMLDPRGIILALMGAFGFALSFAWNSAKLRHADAMAVTLHMVFAGGVATAVYVLLSESGQFPPEARGWLLFLIPAVCFTFAMLGMYEGVKRIGGAPAAMLMNLEPVLTVALAPLVLSETLTPMHVAGGLLVIAAVYVSERARSDAGEVEGRA
jgi:drug/metabolite transporter (DMT)-like permease